MKGISPLIATVIVIMISITAIGIVLTVINPTINRAQDTATINQALQNMKILDDTVRQVASEGPSAQRSLTMQSSGGDYIVRNSSGIEYDFVSDFNYVPARAVIVDGRVRMSTGMSALGLVGYWRFDAGGGTIANDSSGKMNDGYFLSSGVTWTQGKNGNALNFIGNSSSYVNVSDSSSLHLTNGVTLIAWIKTTNTSTFKRIIDKEGSISGYLLAIQPDNTVLFRINGQNTSSISTPSQTVTDGNWHHIVGTYDKNNLTLYVDNVQANITLNSSDINTNNLNLTIGAGSLTNPNNNPMNGTIEDVHIYNRGLAKAEIQDDYNLPPNKLKISLDYDNIIVTGTTRWGQGANKICISKLGTQSGKALVQVRNC